MDSGRFETFIDAILAIMMTVMVLKIPQPETVTINGILDLKIMYFAYVISFIIIFAIWDHHRKLFATIKHINDKVIWVYSVLIFAITLLPYFTAWVAHNPHALIPEITFGLIYIIINILFIIATITALKNDIYNPLIDELRFKEQIIINTVLFLLAAIITIIGYPISILITCLISVIAWNTVPYIENNHEKGDEHGN